MFRISDPLFNRGLRYGVPSTTSQEKEIQPKLEIPTLVDTTDGSESAGANVGNTSLSHEWDAYLANSMFGNYSLDGNVVPQKLRNWPLPLPCHLLGELTEKNPVDDCHLAGMGSPSQLCFIDVLGRKFC